ncbi:bublin coiled-coil protein [Eucyclogobius newberryi]|uniref:bublin coiled-coil protein n=1 Tax=Eucyclogobius newberryi TaxID=166745 RepID=UPI003B5B5572
MSGGPNGDPNMSAEEGIIDDEDDYDDEEYNAVNSMLDQINSYLDDLEEKNDALNGKLHELLESNRQARLEFRAQLNGSTQPDPSGPSPGHEGSDETSGPQTTDND